MSNSVKKTKRQLALSITIVVLVTAIIVGIILVLGSGRETIIVATSEDNVYDTLICKNHDDVNSFYKSSYQAISVEHEVRIVLKDDFMEKIYMKYTGIYENEDVAKKSRALIHANHNELFGSNNISEDIFSSNFTSNGNKLTIELFGETKNINSITSRLFYIDQSEFNKIKSFSSSQIKNAFEKKGFSCAFQD